ncbi:MAG: FKBP-type peptidyl-prolyl cis-trans isomerase [Chromatiaceae bacterium]|jgi:FKBP-type peptidyl-prolyl cis-trans isomerase SlpA|nr:FKBP-type peptidyl-prolyl cis-trans isomerase [Chromatiaceae bacterium]
MTATVVTPGCGLRLHLEIRLPDGTAAISTFGEEPLELRLGDGTLVPALEQLLLGLTEGSETHLLADGSDLYGPREEGKVHWMARSDFPADMDPAPGQVLAFDTPGGHETAGAVLAVDGERVQVDFNHPLSGRPLAIRVQILAVTPPAGG